MKARVGAPDKHDVPAVVPIAERSAHASEGKPPIGHVLKDGCEIVRNRRALDAVFRVMLGNPRAELAGVVNAIGKARVTHERCERERRNVLKRHVFDSHSGACKAAAVVADGAARIWYVVPLRVGLKPYRHAVTLGNRPIGNDC